MKKYYYELQIKPNLYYELFLDLVSSLTQEAIEESCETIIVRSEETLNEIEMGVKAFARELSLAFDTKIECQTTLLQKENIDWIQEYQKSVQPIEIEDFYIHPSWFEPKQKKINIQIDPTLAFGSGHHETTNRSLKAIAKYLKKDMRVCDVGSGSGILAIAAAKLGAVVDICDTDIVAVEDTVKNFQQNGVTLHGFWEGSANSAVAVYDLVIANIVADVLVMISKDLIKITNTNGILILSGIMEQHKQKVIAKFSQKCEIIEQIQENEWVTLVVKKLKD